MLNLPNVTLSIICSQQPQQGLKVLNHCLKQASFGETLFFTSEDLAVSPAITKKIIPVMTYAEYNNFLLFELVKHIKTDFVLTVHTDGFIINADKWKPEFLDYDYVGAPWPREWGACRGVRVGNSAGLRSKKFLEASAALSNPSNVMEDVFLCVDNRDYFESKGLKFAPTEIAADFCREAFCADYPRTYSDVFMFHGKPHDYPTQQFFDLL